MNGENIVSDILESMSNCDEAWTGDWSQDEIWSQEWSGDWSRDARTSENTSR